MQSSSSSFKSARRSKSAFFSLDFDATGVVLFFFVFFFVFFFGKDDDDFARKEIEKIASLVQQSRVKKRFPPPPPSRNNSSSKGWSRLCALSSFLWKEQHTFRFAVVVVVFLS